MVTGGLGNKIDALLGAVSGGGLVKPLEGIWEVTFLIFLHDLEVLGTMRGKERGIL